MQCLAVRSRTGAITPEYCTPTTGKARPVGKNRHHQDTDQSVVVKSIVACNLSGLCLSRSAPHARHTCSVLGEASWASPPLSSRLGAGARLGNVLPSCEEAAAEASGPVSSCTEPAEAFSPPRVLCACSHSPALAQRPAGMTRCVRAIACTAAEGSGYVLGQATALKVGCLEISMSRWPRIPAARRAACM